MANSPDDPKKKLEDYAKFSGLAIQMAVLIILAAYGGKWLDEKLENETPGWTITLILFAIFVSLYQVIRAVIKFTDKDD